MSNSNFPISQFSFTVVTILFNLLNSSFDKFCSEFQESLIIFFTWQNILMPFKEKIIVSIKKKKGFIIIFYILTNINSYYHNK